MAVTRANVCNIGSVRACVRVRRGHGPIHGHSGL